jgi:hypothetical protein
MKVRSTAGGKPLCFLVSAFDIGPLVMTTRRQGLE